MAKYWYPLVREINIYMTFPIGARRLSGTGVYWRFGVYISVLQF